MADETTTFTMLPADTASSPADDLAAAVAGALATPQSTLPVTPATPQPFGNSWEFDFEAGQFVRTGSSPKAAAEFAALEQWCLMAIFSARFAHPVFSDDFGMEEPDALMGEFAIGEALADWQQHLVEALLVHDRVTSIEDLDLSWDPSTGVLTINAMTVVTDEEGAGLTMAAVSVPVGGGQ